MTQSSEVPPVDNTELTEGQKTELEGQEFGEKFKESDKAALDALRNSENPVNPDVIDASVKKKIEAKGGTFVDALINMAKQLGLGKLIKLFKGYDPFEEKPEEVIKNKAEKQKEQISNLLNDISLLDEDKKAEYQPLLQSMQSVMDNLSSPDAISAFYETLSGDTFQLTDEEKTQLTYDKVKPAVTDKAKPATTPQSNEGGAQNEGGTETPIRPATLGTNAQRVIDRVLSQIQEEVDVVRKTKTDNEAQENAAKADSERAERLESDKGKQQLEEKHPAYNEDKIAIEGAIKILPKSGDVIDKKSALYQTLDNIIKEKNEHPLPPTGTNLTIIRDNLAIKMEQKDKLMKQIRGNEKSFERGEAKVKDKITKIDAKIKELENKPTKNQVKEVDKKTEIATLTNEKNELIAKLNGVTTLTQEITQLQEAQKQAFIYHQKSLEQQSKILNTLPIETAENKEGLSEARKALFISMQAHLDRLLLGDIKEQLVLLNILPLISLQPTPDYGEHKREIPSPVFNQVSEPKLKAVLKPKEK